MMIARYGQSLIERYGLVALLLFVLGQATAAIIWGSRLESRVQIIEQRGSPGLDIIGRDISTIKSQYADIERRMPRIEETSNRVMIIDERQKIFIDQLKQNSEKLNAIANDIRKHVNQERP